MAAEAHTNRYKAFLSYSQSDNSNPGELWGDWLHQQLERYEIPPSLVGTPNRLGDPVSQNLYPIFRDQASLPSGGSLREGIWSALRSSDCLVVICTPGSARSDWVREEIREFKKLGRGDRIVAVVVAGRFERTSLRDGSEDADDCFAPELRSGVQETDGVVDWLKATDPIAADMRPKDRSLEGVTPDAFESRLLQRGVDEHTAAHQAERYWEQVRQELLRVIAGILGVQIDVLARRDLEWQAESERRKAEERRSLLTQASQNAHAAAERHFRNGRWEDGIASLGRSLRFDPDNPEPGWHLWSAVLWGDGEREPLPEQAWRLPSPSVSLAVHPITGTVYVLSRVGDVYWQSGGGSEWKSFRAWKHPDWNPTFRSDDFVRMTFDEEGRFLLITTEYALSQVFTCDSDGGLRKGEFVHGLISNPAWSSGYFVWRNHTGAVHIRSLQAGSPENTVLALANEELVLHIAKSQPIVVTYDNRSQVHIYDFLEAKEIARWEMEGTPYKGVLSADGNELLLHDRVDSWSWRSTATGREVAKRLSVPNRHTEPVFNASGDRFAVPDASGHIVVWDRFARTPTQFPSFPGEWTNYLLTGKTQRDQAFWGLSDPSTLICCDRFDRRPARPTAFKLCFQSSDRSPLRTGEFRYFADGTLRAAQGDGSLGPSLGHTYFQVLGRQLLFSPDGQSIAVRNPRQYLKVELDAAKTTPPAPPNPRELEEAVVVISMEPTARPTTEWHSPSFSHPADPTLRVCEYGGRVRVVHSETPRPVAEPFTGEAAEFVLPGWLPNGSGLIAQYLAGETQDQERERDTFQEIRPLRFVPWPQHAAKGDWVNWLVETLSGWDVTVGEERRLSYVDRQERCNRLLGALESADPGIRPPEDWSRLVRWWHSGGQDWNLMTPVPDVPVNIWLRPSSAARPDDSSAEPTGKGRGGAEVVAGPVVRRSTLSSLRRAIHRSRHRRSLMRALSSSAVAAWAGYWAAAMRWSKGTVDRAELSGALKSLAAIIGLLVARFAIRALSRWQMKRILYRLFVARPGHWTGLDRRAETLYRRNLSDPRILHMFASYLDWTDRNDAALERLEEQADQVEGDRNLLIQTAWAAVCSGSIEEAHEWLSKAAAKAGDDPCLADTKAWLSYREGNYQRAWATLRPVLSLSAVHPEIAYHAGVILEALDQEESAMEFFSAAVLHPQPFAGKEHARSILGAG